MSVRELHNSLLSDPYDVCIKDDRYKDDNIIISYSKLRSLFPPQLKQISVRYRVMCGCECCISAKSINSSLLSWCDRYLKNSKIKEKIIKSDCLLKKNITYMKHIKTVMPHGRHIYAKSPDMEKSTMRTYPQYYHALPSWKCVLRFCDDCPCINLPGQETDKNMR